MDFKEIVENRYSCKKFNGEKVPKDVFEKLQHLIRMAPSSFNLQPWKIIIVTDQETKEKLFPHSWNQVQITTCSHLLVLCAETDVDKLISRLKNAMIKNKVDKERVESYIAYMTNAMKKKSEEEVLIWAKNQVFLALGNALNGAKSLGLDACPMGGFLPDEYKKVLDLPDDLVPTVLCPIGYRADSPRPKVRLSKEDIFL